MATIRKTQSPKGTRWQVQVRKKGYPQLTKSFIKRAHAEAWGRKQEVDMEAGAFRSLSEAGRTTLSEVLARYRDEVAGALSVSWSSSLKTLHHHLGHHNLAALQSKHIASYRDTRLQSVSSQTVKHELGLLERVLKKCEKEWGIALPNRESLTVAKPSLPRGRDRRLQGGEEERLLSALQHTPVVQAAVEWAIETGMRRGEIARARWEHVNIKQRTIHVPQTKTGVPRDVPLSPKALSVLQALPRRLDGQVFGVKPDTITQAFNRACSRAGIEGLRFHDLRHEACSRLFERGFETMEVASITGHQDLKMLRKYTHLRAEDLALRMA